MLLSFCTGVYFMKFESYFGYKYYVNVIVLKCPSSNQHRLGMIGQKQSIHSLTLCKYHIICQAHRNIILYCKQYEQNIKMILLCMSHK